MKLGEAAVPGDRPAHSELLLPLTTNHGRPLGRRAEDAHVGQAKKIIDRD